MIDLSLGDTLDGMVTPDDIDADSNILELGAHLEHTPD
jgi:hypothetical protein